jgi:exodeoxyribonuclease V
MRLTEEQKHVIKEAVAIKKDMVTIGGLAGSGKSTIIRHLIELLPNFSVCAYTGKAANVLRKKGVANARTIHSLIYKAYTDEDNRVYFAKSKSLDCEGIIVDEASMVSESIYEDLISFKKPIIFVGDHGQLEPIGDKFNLMQNPDYRLEKIHRNAGEIAHFAEYIRKGFKPASWEIRNGVGDKIKFVSKNNYKNVLLEVDQIICGYNKTRAELNIEIRQRLGRKTLRPEKNDRVMCLKNNSACGLFNGMQGVVLNVFNNQDMFLFEANDQIFTIDFDIDIFNQIKYEIDHDKRALTPFDYCNAITCHKAQGDQFKSVLVLEQRCDLWDHKRWAYTAASRAEEKLYWCN